MKIGYAQNVITPSLERPVFLAGFGNDRRAKTIHDELFARALAIQTDQITLVFASLDLIGLFDPDLSDILRQVNRPDIQIVISSTHTHHGPDTAGLWGPDHKTRGVDLEYMSAIKKKTVDTVIASLSGLKEASAKWTSVQVPGLVKNARNPEIIDNELTLAQFIGMDNKPLATMVNFPCHPEVLWEHNPHITSDYVGYLRDGVEKQTGAPCIFFAGALGGMMTPNVRDHSFEEAESMGRKLAEEGLSALRAVDSESLPAISARKREIRAKLTNLLYKIAFWQKLLPDVRDKKGYVHTEVNLIKIGGLWLATVPGELLPKLGLEIKSRLLDAGAQTAGVIGLANGWFGYILPIEDFKYPWNPFEPGAHYEETNSIGKEIGPKVLEGIESLL